MSLKDSLIGLFIIFIWGFNFVVIAWGVDDMPPLLMGAARFLLVAVLGSLFVKRPDIPLKWLMMYAFVLCFGQFAFLFSAIAFGMPAGLASLVLQSQALFTIVLSVFLLKESISFNQVLSMIVAGLGLYCIGVSQQQTLMTGLGFALTLAGALSWAFGNVINRMINQRGYRAGLGLVVWSAWFAIIPFALMSVVMEGPELIWASIVNISLSSVLVLLYLAIMASIVGYSLWSYLLAHYPAGQVAPLTLGVPVVGLVCAMFFLDENVSMLQWLGITLVMFGLLINALGKKMFKWCKQRLLNRVQA
ncbi:EamA family transporter [Thalassotalea atypica]|uniref:EamA family transporter n=1 Tax=Thalassotalea atypica TaxID=2054316 RepID=UPI0025729709|nr:EamA family transporter [Thalassotalea atypica]